MKYYFSELLQTIKSEQEFTKWIEERKAEIKQTAYDKRDVIDKRCLRDEFDNMDSIRNLWTPFRSLMDKDKGYDLIVKIDRKGYLSFDVVFPVTEDQIQQALDYRAESHKKGYWFVTFNESMHRVCKDYVKATLGGILDLCDQPYDYPSFDGDRLRRYTSFWRAK
jgi:hypothetical protein